MDEVTPTIWSGTIPVPKDLQPTQFGAPIEIIDLTYAIQVISFIEFLLLSPPKTKKNTLIIVYSFDMRAD